MFLNKIEILFNDHFQQVFYIYQAFIRIYITVFLELKFLIFTIKR